MVRKEFLCISIHYRSTVLQVLLITMSQDGTTQLAVLLYVPLLNTDKFTHTIPPFIVFILQYLGKAEMLNILIVQETIYPCKGGCFNNTTRSFLHLYGISYLIVIRSSNLFIDKFLPQRYRKIVI